MIIMDIDVHRYEFTHEFISTYMNLYGYIRYI